jgi:hypothetical protein
MSLFYNHCITAHVQADYHKFSEPNTPEKTTEVYKRRLSCDYHVLI